MPRVISSSSSLEAQSLICWVKCCILTKCTRSTSESYSGFASSSARHFLKYFENLMGSTFSNVHEILSPSF